MKRLQKLRERLTFWRKPAPAAPETLSHVLAEASVAARKRQDESVALRGLLRKSGEIIEGLEIRAEQASDWRRDEMNRRMEIIGELEEAAALADGAPWQGATRGQSHAGKQLIKAGESLRKIPLRETVYGMQELELALEDRGWKRLIAQSNYEFSRFGIQSIMLICRLNWIKNPLARRGVDVSAFYVFGRGLEISSNDEAAHETLTDFFDDPRNASQFSHTALVKAEKKTYTDGNVFWAFFADPKDGRLVARGLDTLEISDIITDPEDADTPWFYRRDWTEQRFDPATGRRDPVPQTQWYFALGYEDMPNFPAKQREIEGHPVALDSQGQPIPVMHLKDGELPGWRFGCPRMYPAIDWLRAYRQVLEDLCTTWRALARFAWNVETKGGAPAIAAFKQTLATNLANDLSQIETNPPPVTASAFIAGLNNKVTPVNTGGATMNPDNARRVFLMVAAAFGLNENLLGDASTGSLATAQSLERSVELMFRERQELWTEVLQRIGQYALSRSLKAPKGKLREAVAKRWGCLPSEVDPSKVLIETTPRKMAGAVSIKLSERKEVRKVVTPDSQSAAGQGPIKADLSEAGRTAKEQQKEKITIDVKFPDILEGGIGERIDAIVHAMTLDGKTPTGIDEKTGMGLLLSELGVENVQEVLEAMYPEETYEMDRTLEPALPTRITAVVTDPAADAAQKAAGNVVDTNAAPPGVKANASESISRDPVVIDRAVQQLIAAARRNLQEAKRRSA